MVFDGNFIEASIINAEFFPTKKNPFPTGEVDGWMKSKANATKRKEPPSGKVILRRRFMAQS